EDWIASAINSAKNHTQKDAAVAKDALRCNRWIASSALQKAVRRGEVALAERAATLHRVLLSSGAPHGRGIRLPADQETPVNTLRRLSTSRLILDRRVDQHRMPDGKGQIDHLQRPEVVAHPDFVGAHKCRGS